jgi:hypothetical protein
MIVPYEKIPYTLSPIEVENWLFAYGGRPSVRTYLETGLPPWGIIERANVMPGQDGNYLLFIPTLDGRADAANLRIVLVTGLSIVAEVQKAPYKSPDDVGFWENLKKELDDTLESAGSFAKWAVVGMIALAVLQLTRK